MNFNFLQIKLNSSKADFEGKIKYQDSSEGVMMYHLTEMEQKKLFGYLITSIKLYFYENLISVSYIIETSIEEYPDLIDCISLITGLSPKLINKEGRSSLQWKNQEQTLYCLPDHQAKIIQLYNTLNKYDVIYEG